MKKICVVLSLIITIFAVIAQVTPTVFSGAKVKAETITTNRLEYFKLDKPLAVDRDEDRIFIAQKDMIIIYHNETYDKIQIVGGDISYIEKCGNHLLFLNADMLYSLNLATNEISEMLFQNVSSFSVSGNFFAINQIVNQVVIVKFFEVTDTENFLFNEVYANYNTNGEVTILNPSPAFALAPDLTFYYFAVNNGQIWDMDSSGRQGDTFENAFDSVEQLFFDHDNGVLYFKSNTVIYRYLFASKKLESILNLANCNVTNCGKFCVDGNLLLICDVNGNRVIEYDLQTLNPTGFEISFTKIDLPENFNVDYNQNPNYITVKKGDRLYDIDFTLSKQNGYFLYNGYHEQKEDNNYLIISEINGIFYLVSGDCYALVLKENYTSKSLDVTEQEDSYGFMTNGGYAYDYPHLLPEFLSFKFDKHEKVRITHLLTFNGVDYAIIQKGEESGFIPTSFILNEIYVAPEHNSFTTATTSRKTVSVYQEKELVNKSHELEKFSTVIIVEEYDNCYLIRYDGDKTGFVEKNSIVKRGSYTNKIVFAVILLALSLTITIIHFLLKYLYKRKKTL